MGSRMAANLLHAGFPVVIYDQSPKTLHDYRDSGAETAASPAELATFPGKHMHLSGGEVRGGGWDHVWVCGEAGGLYGV